MSINISRRDEPITPDLLEHYPPLIAKILANRHIESAAALDYRATNLLRADGFAGIQNAVTLLHQARVSQQRITIVGDFDADGATSTAVLMEGLRLFGFHHVDFLVPNRFDYGYGLSPEIVDEAAKMQSELIITVDNGISSLQGAQRCRELGIKLLITDHHLPGESLPCADAIINPNLADCGFSSKNLAGVGVAFYLLVAYRAYLAEQDWFTQNEQTAPNLASLLDLVALGTVADVVVLDDNNRILVHQGLQRIRSRQCRPGILALLEIANREADKLVSADLGFAVAPRLNAAGRLDDMTVGIQCLLATDMVSARRLAFQLDNLNQKRKAVEAEMQQDAEQMLAHLQLADDLPAGLALFQDHWHQGVVGILAGRVKERYFRPTIAFARQDQDFLKGSARSIPGVHIRDLLEELNSRYPDLIIKFGGHAAAAGLSIAASKFEAFSTCFAALCEEIISPQLLTGVCVTDGELSAADMSFAVAQQLRECGPWGQGFPEPTFDGIFDLLEQRIVGERHLKMQVKHASGLVLDAIAFNVDIQQWPDNSVRHVQLVYKLDVNEFRGRRTAQLLVDAIAAV